ncbi:MAG: DUF721 domain-containing protein [Alphaproteobacteria bacterium]
MPGADDPYNNLPKTRRAGGLRPVGLSVSKAAGAAVKRQGIARSELVTRWSDIVGADIAKMARPLRIKAGARGQTGPTLVLGTLPKSGLILQHLEPDIIARINTFFGQTLVQHLSFVERRALPKASQANRFRQNNAPRQDTAQDIVAETAAKSAPGVEKVQTTRLQNALLRLHHEISADVKAKIPVDK